MRGKQLGLVISGLIALVSATSALATMSLPAGWYIEGNLGSSNLSNTSYGNGSSANTSGLGGNVNLGYKFMPYFGLELGYTQYANVTIKDQFDNKAGTDKVYSYDIAGRGIWPIIDSGFELFAKLGVGRMNSRVTTNNQTAANNIGLSNSSHNTTGLYLGIGGQYYFIPELALVVQWQSAQGSSSTGTGNLISGGLSFIMD